MNYRIIGYWIATALTAFIFIAGGALDAAHPPMVVEAMSKLGYPTYVALIIGVWKVLGGLLILAPRTPLIKEWAYAGMIIDLTGASASHAAVGEPPGTVVFPLILCLVVAASWFLRPASRKLPGVAPIMV